MGAMTLHDNVSFSLNTCKGYIDDPDCFMEIFKHNLNEEIRNVTDAKKVK